MSVLANPASERVEPVAGLPGFTRGLCFAADRAIVGLSRIRKAHILDAPPVRAMHRRLRAGIALVDPASGQQTGSLEFVRGGSEVYDTVFLPNVASVALSLHASAENCDEPRSTPPTLRRL